MTDHEKLDNVAQYARQQIAEICAELPTVDRATAADLRCELLQWRHLLKMLEA